MIAGRSTPTGSLDVQPRIGGDLALIAKAVLEHAKSDPTVLDAPFFQLPSEPRPWPRCAPRPNRPWRRHRPADSGLLAGSVRDLGRARPTH
jgi:hypothetical protein